MQCPNCQQDELMNVNGRYVCVNCGTEIPENEVMPVSFTISDAVNRPTNANEGSVQVAPVPDDFAQGVIQNPAQPDVESRPEAEPLISDIEGPIQEEAKVSLEQADTLSSMVSEVSDPNTPLPDDKLIESVAEAEEAKQEEIASSVQAEAEPVAIKIDVEQPVVQDEPEVFSSQINETPEALAPALSVPVVETQELVDPFERPRESTEITQNVVQESIVSKPAEIIGTPSNLTENQIGTSEPYSQAQTTGPLPADPNIYQDPVFDKYADPDPEEVAKSVKSVSQEKIQDFPEPNKKKVLALIIAGSVLALILLIAGIITYQILNAPIEPTPAAQDTWSSYQDEVTGFSAKFPADPKISKLAKSFGATPFDFTEVSSTTDDNQTRYVVEFFKNAESEVSNEEKIKLYLADEAKYFNAELISKEEADFNGSPAADFLMKGQTNSYKGKIFLTDDSIYFIFISYATDLPSDYDKYISSFTISEPTVTSDQELESNNTEEENEN